MLKYEFNKTAAKNDLQKQKEIQNKVKDIAAVLNLYVDDAVFRDTSEWTSDSTFDVAFHKAITYLTLNSAKMFDFVTNKNMPFDKGNVKGGGEGSWKTHSVTLTGQKGTLESARSCIVRGSDRLAKYKLFEKELEEKRKTGPITESEVLSLMKKYNSSEFKVADFKKVNEPEVSAKVQAALAEKIKTETAAPTTPSAPASPSASTSATAPVAGTPAPSGVASVTSSSATPSEGKSLKGGIATILKFIDTGLLKLDIKGLDFTSEKKRTQAFIIASENYEQAASKIIEHGNLSEPAKKQLTTADGMSLEQLRANISGDSALLREEKATGFNAENRKPTLYVTAGIMEMFQFISSKFVEANGTWNVFTNAQEAADKMKKFLPIFGGKSKAELKAERKNKSTTVTTTNTASDQFSTRAFKVDIMNKVASRRERVRKEMMTPDTPTEAAMMRRIKVRSY